MAEPTPPPLPERTAADAAAGARVPTRPTHDPAADPDDTGVPTAAGRGFLPSLFDLSFRTFITRRLATVIYAVALVLIGMAFLVYFIGGIVSAIGLMRYNVGGGISLLVSTIVIIPVVSFFAVLLARLVIEGVVALIAIAENTERTAENTRR